MIWAFSEKLLESVPSFVISLSNQLLKKFELLKTEIKEYCITVSKFPSGITPKTYVVSFFIVDSLLDDLNHLINHKADMIVGVNNQIATLHEEVMLLRSSVMEIVVQQPTEHEELVIQTRDIAYEVEYVINSFPPFWYHAMRLPQLIQKIKLIRMAIQEMKNNIDEAGKPKVANYPGEQVSLQSKEMRILEDFVVGYENATTEIAEQLVRGSDQMQIISIFGMPGLCKTTLAKKLYNDPSIVYHFDKRAWSLVFAVERRSDGGVKTCVIHDLMRDMCLRIAEEENFLKAIEDGGAYYSASCRQQATKDESFQIINLQSISLLTISDKTDEKILRCSPNLHKLKSRVGSSLNHSFDFLNQLKSLKLSIYDDDKEDSRSLLFSLPLTLKKLSLDNVDVSLEQMEIIGILQNLEVLKLEDVVLEGEQWDASEAEFPQLKFLKLDNVLIAEWNASSDNFPT
ncbi:NB-ARC domain-containing protein [Abeliophyllum distichum]|uniref:NB-ARC domain-containing protein n=1 Tax=Abeliophyllum distichum TaxID=126358 RepID=A0ABD1V593_9LAMI